MKNFNFIDIMSFNITSFFKIPILTQNDLHKILKKSIKKYKTFINILNKIRELNIKVYLIPLPFDENGIYWADFANSYIKEILKEKDYFSNEHIYITFYLDAKGKKIHRKYGNIYHYITKITTRKKVAELLKTEFDLEWGGRKDQTMKLIL